MSPARLLREIAYPLTTPAVLLAMVMFFLLIRLAYTGSMLLLAGNVLAIAIGIFGIVALIALLPGLFRYLLNVLDARIAGREVEPPVIEDFSWMTGLWPRMPLIILAAGGWAALTLNEHWGVLPAVALSMVLLLFYPASIGLLSLTRSWLGSINPLAIATLLEICGHGYFIVPAVVGSLAGFLYVLSWYDFPGLLLEFGFMYLFFLMFSLTGVVLAASNVLKHVENPPPVEPGAEAIEAVAEKQRMATLDHAYGLVSRGNRAGGFAHIDAFLSTSGGGMDNYRWFFENMLRWENPDPALHFAQRYLARLLDSGEHHQALKLLGRCLLESPRFRPLPEDRDRVLDLLEELGREDLARQLKG